MRVAAFPMTSIALVRGELGKHRENRKCCHVLKLEHSNMSSCGLRASRKTRAMNGSAQPVLLIDISMSMVCRMIHFRQSES